MAIPPFTRVEGCLTFFRLDPLPIVAFSSCPKESVADLEGKVKELEGFCTEALDELDAEKAKNAKLLAAANVAGS